MHRRLSRRDVTVHVLICATIVEIRAFMAPSGEDSSWHSHQPVCPRACSTSASSSSRSRCITLRADQLGSFLSRSGDCASSMRCVYRRRLAARRLVPLSRLGASFAARTGSCVQLIALLRRHLAIVLTQRFQLLPLRQLLWDRSGLVAQPCRRAHGRAGFLKVLISAFAQRQRHAYPRRQDVP